ncbi:MAG: hypothetical protein ABC606_00830 [Candidatus Methanosuratincola petrocarbonis]
MDVWELSEPERILLKKAQISEGRAITVEEGERILREKAEREYSYSHGRPKWYSEGGQTRYVWFPGRGRPRVSDDEVGRAEEFLEGFVALGLMEKVQGDGGGGEGEPGEEEVKYRLTAEGEEAARRIPFRYPLYMDI